MITFWKPLKHADGLKLALGNTFNQELDAKKWIWPIIGMIWNIGVKALAEDWTGHMMHSSTRVPQNCFPYIKAAK